MENDSNSIKIVLPTRRETSSSNKQSSKKSLENTIWLKTKLWRRKLSRTRKTINKDDDDDDDNNNNDNNNNNDITPSGECVGLANQYNIILGNVTDLQYSSSNLNILINNYKTTLIVLELHHCGIMNENMIEIIGECTSIRYLNLESNLLTNIPLCLCNLKELQYLNLKRNQIGRSAVTGPETQGKHVITKEIKEVIVRLKLLSNKLVYLNTSLNPISTLQVYRTIVLKSIPSLLALDSHVYSDEEHFIIKSSNISFGTENIPGHYSLRLPTSLITIPSEFYNYLVTININKQLKLQIPITEVVENYPMLLNNLLNKRYKLLKNIRILSSPICKIQKIIRKWLWHTKYHVFRKVLPKLQALVRRKLLHWKINNEMLWILRSANLGHLINPENNGLTKEEIELKVAMTTIKKFLKQCIVKAKYNKCARRIQRKFRAILNSKNAHLKWLQKNKVKGIIITSDYVYRIINILEEIFRRRDSGNDMNTFKFEDIVKKELTVTTKEDKVESMKTFQSLDYDKTYSTEDVNDLKLHFSTSYHKLKRKNITKIIYQPFPKQGSTTYLFNKRNSTFKNAGTFKILQYLRTFNEYSTSFYKIKARGNIISDEEKLDFAYVIANKNYRYYATAMSLKRIVVSDPRALCDLGITLKGLNIRFTYDTVIYRDAAAIVIQRAYRGKCVRAGYAKKFIQKLLRRRATIAVQRWWRYSNTLKRRMNLHSFISKSCRSLTSNVVYLDSWTFFAALKAETLPSLINELKLFPEFRGVPAVDESGGCCFKYLYSDYMGFMEKELGIITKSESRVELSVHDSSKSLTNEKENEDEVVYSQYGSLFEGSKNHFNPKDRARFGLPKWAFWSTTQKLKSNEVPSTTNSRRDSKFAMFDIMTKGSSISMKIIKPKFSDDLHHHLQETLPTDVLGMHVIEIKFRNIQEARERCALLILASYDYRSRTGIVMSSADDMIKKINNRSTDIAKALLLSNKDKNLNYNNDVDDFDFEIGGSYDPNKSRIGSHVTPIEIKVQYNYCPKWIEEYDYDIRDLIRFRFMCESLKQLVRDKQLTIQKHKYDEFSYNDININKKTPNENEIDEKGSDDNLGVNADIYQPTVGSMEYSQISTNYHEQKYIIDWDAEISSLYGHNYSLLSSVNVDPGQPAPIIPTSSIGFIEPSYLDNFFVDKVRPNTSPKLSSNYKKHETDESIERMLLWCSRDNNFDILKGGYDDKKVNLFSLTPPVVLGTTEVSSISRLETIILAEYYSYVQRCNSRHTAYREKPQSANAISRNMRSAIPENIIDVIHKEYDDNEVAILYNVRRVFGCKEVDSEPSTDLEWKEKLAKAKYNAACKSRQEKEYMLKRINVKNAFEECAKKDIVRNVIKSRGESREKIARKLLERDQNIMSREAKSREAKSREGNVNTDDDDDNNRIIPSKNIIINDNNNNNNNSNNNNNNNKVNNDMNTVHKQYKDKLRSNVLAHKQQKQVKQAERLFCQNLQKSFNALIKKTEADSKSKHKRKPPLSSSSSSLLYNDTSNNNLISGEQNIGKDSVYNPATISLASEQVSYKSIGVHPIPTTNTLQRRVSFTDVTSDVLTPKTNGFDEKIIAKIMASKKYSPVTIKSPKKSGSFTVTLPSISSTFTDAISTDTTTQLLNMLSDINDIPDKLPII